MMKWINAVYWHGKYSYIFDPLCLLLNHKNDNFISDFMSEILLSPYVFICSCIGHHICITLDQWNYVPYQKHILRVSVVKIDRTSNFHHSPTKKLLLFSLFQRIESFLKITNIKRFHITQHRKNPKHFNDF